MASEQPQSSRPLDIDAVLANPTAYFDSPQDVLNRPGMSVAFKLKVLRQWEHDARLLADAEGEGMTGGEESMLGRVRAAIRNLENDAGEKTAADSGGAIRASGGALKKGFDQLAEQVHRAAIRAEESVTEFRKFMRGQPITGALFVFGLGYLFSRIFSGRR
jgi:hypothetical protein